MNVTYLHRKEFRTWMAYLSCSFGSFEPGFPEGSAHFLEHRLFSIHGEEATALFSDLGADINAFTSRRVMGFYFSTLRNPYQCLQLLIDLVLEQREFDIEAIENERKIIESEILMVEDEPFTMGYQNLLEQLYWDHPIRVKIAGTKDSILKVNSKILKQIHTTFFTPSSCRLFVCGDEEPEDFLSNLNKKVKNNHWNPLNIIKPTYFYDEPMTIKTNFSELKIPISKDLFFMGIKTRKKQFHLIDSLIGEFICHILFGSISSFIDYLYEKKLIDDTFYFSYDMDLDFGYLILSGYTSASTKLKKEINDEINRRLKTGITQEEFDLIKNYYLSSSYMMIDKPNDLMMQIANLSWLENSTWEDYLVAIKKLDLEKINQELPLFLSLENSAVTLIHPI